MFDRIPFRLMPKAFRTFSKFLLALVFFTLPNLVPQGVFASSGDTFSGSASGAVSGTGFSTFSSWASFSGMAASGAVLVGPTSSGSVSSWTVIAGSAISLSLPKPKLPHLVQTGLRAEHNLPEEILGIEARYPGARVSTVALIYDDYGTGTDTDFRRTVTLLWTGRVYHVTVSPFGLTSAQVASWAFDESYSRFFRTARELKVKVLFRTMHEMNGGWYSWSSHPADFRRAFKHVSELARFHALPKSTFKMVFSVNSLDLPTKDAVPTQSSPLVHCELDWPVTEDMPFCPTFEDYWPGDEYVDVVGTTLYNWGRAKADKWAGWKTAEEMLGEYGLLVRLQRFWKPVGLDEVGTTSARFNGKWTWDKARASYLENLDDKNAWIADLARYSAFGGNLSYVVYFNCDKTYWLSKPVHGELDWRVLSPENPTEYVAALDFLALGNGKWPYAPKSVKKSPKKSFQTAWETAKK